MELKPCPFCGGMAIALQVGENFSCRQFQVICHWYEGESTGCGASSGFFDSLREAIEAWNRRRSGKWTLHGDGSATCSECHFRQAWVWDPDNWQRFCGHCGAEMTEANGE